MLDRDAAMRPLVLHGRNDAGLAIAPFDRADAGSAAQRRIPAIGADDQPATQPRAVAQGDRGAHRARRHPGDAARREQPQAGQRVGALDQHPPQYPVLDDIAERRALAGRGEFAMVVMHEQRRGVIGDADFEDRLGLAGDLRPQPDPLEHQPRAVGDRRGAAVEPARQHLRRVLAVDDGDLQPGAGAGDPRATARSARRPRSPVRHRPPSGEGGRAPGRSPAAITRSAGRTHRRLGIDLSMRRG